MPPLVELEDTEEDELVLASFPPLLLHLSPQPSYLLVPEAEVDA
jgi:hypothetical protein